MTQLNNKQDSLIKNLSHWVTSPYQNNSFPMYSLHSLLRIILLTWKEYGKNELNIRASALTYTILLSLVPLLAMSTAVVKGLGGGNELRQVVYSYIDTLEETIPITHVGLTDKKTTLEENREDADGTSATKEVPITEHFRSGADQIFDYVDKTDFATLGSIGVLGVLISAILVLSNIELSMNAIWHVPAGRSFLRKVTDYLTFLILMPLSINFGFAANAILKNDTLLQKLVNILPGSLVQIAILFLVPLFFITLTLFLIYIFFPNTKVKPVPAFIGAAVAGTFWFLTQNIYIGLQIGVSKYNAIYGSFATLPLFLIWMFLGWVFILGGAQIAFACQRHKTYQLKRRIPSPLEELSAAIDILNVTYSAYSNNKKLLKKQLPGHCPAYTPELIFNTLKHLTQSRLVATTEKGQILPCGSANQLKYKQIVSSILGNSFPETEGGQAASVLFQQANPILNKKFSKEGIHGS